LPVVIASDQGAIAISAASPLTISGTVQAWQAGPVGISGTIKTYDTGIQAVSGTVQAWQSGPVGISGTIKTYDTGIQAVSGTVQVWSAEPLAITGTVQTWTSGPQAVSGTVQAWQSGPVGISGTIKTYDTGIQAVSGTVQAWNAAPQAVSGSQLTGSTFIGSPVIIGGIYLTGSSIGVSASIVKAIQTDISGAVYITTSGTLPVSFPGGVSVTVTGSTGLHVANSAIQPLWITSTGSIAVTFPVSSPLNVQGTVIVSGSQLTGSTFTGSPVVIGGVYLTGSSIGVSASLVRAIQTDISGAVYITTSGTIPVSFSTANPLSVTGSVAVLNQIFITTTGSLPVSFPPSTTLNVTGSVGITNQVTITSTGSLPVVLVGTQTITGSVGITNVVSVTTSGSLPVIINGVATITGSVAITAASLPLPAGAATSANQTTLDSQTTKINDGTNTATVKAASTAVLATDTAIVVALSPNSNDIAVAYYDYGQGESATWDNTTNLNVDVAAIPPTVAGNACTVSISLTRTGTITAGEISFQGSDATGGVWFPVKATRIESFTTENSILLSGVADIMWKVSCAGFFGLRAQLSTQITGAGSVFITTIWDTSPVGDTRSTVGQSDETKLNATTTLKSGLKGSSAAALVTSTASGADHQILDVAIYDGSGNQISTFGGGTQYVVDAAAPTTPTGSISLAQRDDQLSTVTPVEGDWIQPRASSKGALWVTIPDVNGDPITSFGGGTQYTVNAVAPADPVGTALVAERDDQLSVLSEVEGDWTQVRASSKGALWVTIPDTNGDPITSFGGGIQFGSGTLKTATNVTGTLQIVDDGVNFQSVKGDTSGRQIIVGAIASGSTAGGNPILFAGTDVSGRVQVPQVDNILGKTPKQISTAATITSPAAAAAGLYAQVTVAGALRVAEDAIPLFTDSFDGSVIDITNRWTTSSGTGGSVIQVSGSLVVSGSTSANSFGKAITQPTFSPIGGSFIVYASATTFGGTSAGVYRFFGLGTSPTTPTTTIPLTDAIGFEYDTSSNLYAVIYTSGSNVYRSSALTAPGTSRHTYVILSRGDTNIFYYDDTEIPIASSLLTQYGAQTLPVLIETVVGGSGVAIAPNIVTAAMFVGDTGHSAQAIADGTYSWRKATVKAASTSSVATDSALVVALSPNSQGPFAFGGDDRLKTGQETITFFDTFEGAAISTINWVQSQSGMTQTVTSAGLLLNAASSLTSGNYSIATTNKSFRATDEFGLYFQYRCRIITQPNAVIEFGRGTAATTAAPTDGVFFRIASSGAMQAVTSFGGTEVVTQLLAAGAFNTTDYYGFEIELYEDKVIFEVYVLGEIVATLTKVNTATQAASTASAFLPIFTRVYNSGAVATTAAQLYVGNCVVNTMDSGPVFADYSSVTSVASSATNVTLLAANPNRKGVIIFNDSTQVVFVKMGVTASATSFTYRLTSNSTLELPLLANGRPWSGQVDAIWNSANGNARITELF
jgi:uncharacterized phage-associated protein